MLAASKKSEKKIVILASKHLKKPLELLRLSFLYFDWLKVTTFLKKRGF